ncbi:MAG TPA: hypothetical protein VEP89_04125 [Draconibacterium sp.]|nr:hypothetical protein [Draconibacterium sp.]
MNRKSLIIYIAISLLVLFNILFIVKDHIQSSTIQEFSNNCKILKERYELLTKTVEYGISVEAKYEGSVLKSQEIDSLSSAHLLFLRINTRSCQACIKTIIATLNKIDSEHYKKIIILGTFNNKQEFNYYRQNILKLYHVIDLERDFLWNSQLEKEKIPYFFRIDNKNRIFNLFIPEKNLIFLTEKYLENILPCIKQ